MKERTFRMLRSGIAMLLALCMVVGYVPAVAFATETGATTGNDLTGLDRDDNGQINYVALGDSMTNGYGQPGYYLILQQHEAEYHDKNTGLCTDPSLEGNALQEGSPKGCAFYYGPYVEDTRFLDWGNNYGYLSNAPEAYPTALSDLLETETGKDVYQLNLAVSGMRAEDLRFVLDPGYYGDGYTGRFFREDFSITGWAERRFDNSRNNALHPWQHNFDDSARHQYLRDLKAQVVEDPNLYVDYKALGIGEGNNDHAIAQVRSDYQYALKKAELITVALGTNNFGTGVQSAMYRTIKSAFGVELGDTTDFKYNINDVLTEFPELADVYPQVTEFIRKTVMDMPEIVGMFENEADAEKAVNDIVATYSYGLLGFIANYKESLKLIREMNPDAPIVVVAAMNIEEGIHFIIDGKDINFGDLYGTIVDAGNTWLAGYVADMDNVYYSETEDLSLIVDEIAEGKWNSNMLSLMAADFAWNSGTFDDKAKQVRTLRVLNTFGIHNAAVLEVVDSYLANPEDAAAVAAMNAEAQKIVDRYAKFGETAHSWHVGIDLDEAILALKDYHIAMQLLTAMEKAAKDPYVDMDAVISLFKDEGFKAIFTNTELLNDSGVQDLLYFYTRMMFANGAGVHPSVKGHRDIANDIVKSLKEGRSGAADAEQKEEELKAMAKDAMLSYLKGKYPEAFKALNGAGSLTDSDDLARIVTMLKMSDSEALEGVDLDALEADIRTALKNFEASKTPEETAAAQEDIKELTHMVWALGVAATATKYVPTEKSYYVSFGDSNVNGLGLDGYKETNNEVNNLNGIGQYIEDSAPALLAKELFGEDWMAHFAPYAQGGIRVEDLYYILGGEIEPDQYFHDRILQDGADNSILLKGNVEDTRADYIATLQKADLISFVIGGGNISTYVAYQIEQAANDKALAEMDWDKLGFTDSSITELKAMIQELVPIVDALDLMDKYVPENMEIENPARFATVLIESLLYGYATYNHYYGLVLEQIRDINSDAQLLVLGMFNPIDDWMLTMEMEGKERVINIGGIAENALNMANLQSLAYALQNNGVSYVDIGETETFLDAATGDKVPSFEEYYNGIMADNGKNTHANKNGHKYIFEQMNASVNGKNTSDELDALAQEILNVLNDNYLTTGEKLNHLGKAYEIAKKAGALNKYPEVAVAEEICTYLSSNEYINEEQSLAIVLHIYVRAMDRKVDDAEKKEIGQNLYETLVKNNGVSEEAKADILAEVYAILRNNGLLSNVSADLGIVEMIAVAIDPYVTDKQAVEIADYVYEQIKSGNVDKMAIAKGIYEMLIGEESEVTTENKLSIIKAVYGVLKAEGMLSGNEKELAVLEEIVIAVDPYTEDDQAIAIVDMVYELISDGSLEGEEMVLAEFVYGELMGNRSLTDTDRMAIILGIYEIIEKHGYLNNVGTVSTVKKIADDLQDANLLTDEQYFDIVDYIFKSVCAENFNIRNVLIYVYYTLFDFANRDVVLEKLNIPVAMAMAMSYDEIDINNLTAIQKLDIIKTIYEGFKDDEELVAEIPQMEVVSTLMDELVLGTEDAEAMLPETLAVEIIEIAFETLVVENAGNENEQPGEGEAPEAGNGDVTISAEVITKLTEQITEKIVESNDVDPVKKLEIAEKVVEAVQNANKGEGDNNQGGEEGGNTGGAEKPAAPAIPGMDIAKKLVTALTKDGLMTNEHANALIAELYPVLKDMGSLSNEGMLDLVNNIYGIVFWNTEYPLTAPQQVAIIGELYTVLKEAFGEELGENGKYLKVLENIVALESLQKVSAEKTFDLVDFIFNKINDAEVTIDEIRTIIGYVWTETLAVEKPANVFAKLRTTLLLAPGADLTVAEKLTIIKDVMETLAHDPSVVPTEYAGKVNAVVDLYDDLTVEKDGKKLIPDSVMIDVFDKVMLSVGDPSVDLTNSNVITSIGEDIAQTILADERIPAADRVIILKKVTATLAEIGMSDAAPGYDIFDENGDINLSELYNLVQEYGPQIAAQVWQQWVDAGYVADVEATINELLATLETRYEYYTTEALPAIDASVLELVAQKDALLVELDALKVELAAKKAELEDVISKQEISDIYAPDINIDVELGDNEQTTVPENECVVESATIKGELEAAIRDIEHAIATIEALIADIEADVADMVALAEQIAAAVAELEKHMESIAVAAKDLNAAVLAVAEVLENSNGVVDSVLKSFDAARETVLAASKVLDLAMGVANEMIADIDGMIAEVAADAEALYNKVVADLPAALAQMPEEMVMAIGIALYASQYVDVAAIDLALQAKAAEYGITEETLTEEYIMAEIAKIAAEYGVTDETVLAKYNEITGKIDAHIAEKYAQIEADTKAQIAALEAEATEKIATLELELEGYKAQLAELAEDAAEEVKAGIQAQIDRVTADIATVNADLEHAVAHLNNAAEMAYQQIVAEAMKIYENAKAAVEAEIAALEEQLKAMIPDLEATVEGIKAAVEAAKATIEGILNANIESIEDLMNTLVALGAEEAAKLVQSVVDQINAIFKKATSSDLILHDDFKYVAIGDGSAAPESYVEKLAAELNVEAASKGYNEISYVNNAKAGNTVAAERANLSDVTGADLITVGFSNVNFLSDALNKTIEGAEVDWANYVGEENVEYVDELLAEVDAKLAEGIEDAAIRAYVMNIAEAYAYSAVEYAVELPALINEINAVNPDALVIIVGMYNPLENVTIALNETTTLDIGEYVDYLVKGVAVHGIAYSVLTGNAIYVDAPAVETAVSGKTLGLMDLVGLLTSNFAGMYPAEAGHEYIKNQILNALDLDTDMLGDVNDDGKVDVLDLMRLANYFAKGVSINMKNADVNCDGKVDVLDLMRLANYFAGVAKLG